MQLDIILWNRIVLYAFEYIPLGFIKHTTRKYNYKINKNVSWAYLKQYN